MVGDVKQSIYRFRLSRPELFLEKFYTYNIEESQTQRIDLHRELSKPEGSAGECQRDIPADHDGETGRDRL